jgi:hypothetical protein
MFPEQNIIDQGRAAWDRLRVHARKSWGDWLAVGYALRVLRQDALLEAKTDKPYGKIYTRAFGRLLCEHGLDDIGQQVRWRLRQILEHESDIALWLSTLSEQQRCKLSHPDSIWMHYNRDFAPDRQVHNRIARHTVASSDQRGKLPAHPDQGTIRFIAAELRENWTTDTFRLAVIAYHAVLRSVEPPPKPARRTEMPADAAVHA